MTSKTENQNRAYYNVFYTKGFNGWLNHPCSICGKVHPGSCDITKDPAFNRAYEDYKAQANKKV